MQLDCRKDANRMQEGGKKGADRVQKHRRKAGIRVSGCQIKSRLLQIKQHRHMAGVR